MSYDLIGYRALPGEEPDAAQVASGYQDSAARVLPAPARAGTDGPPPRRRRVFGRRKKDD